MSVVESGRGGTSAEGASGLEEEAVVVVVLWNFREEEPEADRRVVGVAASVKTSEGCTGRVAAVRYCLDMLA